MSDALWLLLRLQLVGWLRYLFRGFWSVRGALGLLVGLAVFAGWIALGSLSGNEGRPDRGMVERFGPAMLLFYCVVNVLSSPGDRSIYFSPAEVQLLFAGPFSRREILVYKIVLALLVSLPMALLIGVVVRLRDGWPPAVLLGLLLISAFMQLFTMALGLLGTALGASLYTRGRQILLALATVAVAIVAVEVGRRSGWRFGEMATQAVETRAWQLASWPLRCFFDVLTAERLWPDLIVNALIAGGVDILIVGIILALDHGYQEASAASSARRYAALQRLRGQSAGAEHEGPTRKARGGVPELPFWGGIGPVLWRQLTGAFRAFGRLAMVLLLVGATLGVTVARTLMDDSPDGLMIGVFGMVVWVSVFLTALVPFDFRGDLDRIALLKSLPLAAWRLSLAQLLTPTLILSVFQWLALVALVVLVPAQRPLAASCAVCVPLFNFLLIGLDNLLFLFFPVRLMASTPGDFQTLGRNVLLSFGKVIGLVVLGFVSSVPAVVVYLLTKDAALSVLSTAPVMLFFCASLVPLVTLAFRRFDVGRNIPA